jgi:hypothetical protein
MSTRWIRELVAPGNADMSSVYASYVLTAIFGLALVGAGYAGSRLLSLAAGISAVLQVPLLIGVVISKTRASIPPPTGLFGTISPKTLADASWARALIGFVVTGLVLLALLVKSVG